MRDLVNPIWNLFDAAAHHYNIKVKCPDCEHSNVIHAAALWRHFHAKEWCDDLREAGKHLYCQRCRDRGKLVRPRLALSDECETILLPLPSKSEWKQATARRR